MYTTVPRSPTTEKQICELEGVRAMLCLLMVTSALRVFFFANSFIIGRL